MSNLRFKPGDRVVVIAAGGMPWLLNTIRTIKYVGPWKTGDEQPNGGFALAPCDYILEHPEYIENEFGAPGIACREANLAALN